MTVTALQTSFRELRTVLGDGPTRRHKRELALATLATMFNLKEQRRRIEAFRDAGLLDTVPTPWQMALGSYKMMFEFLVPTSKVVYDNTGKSFWWQQLLRLVDEPSAVMDPIGLFAPKQAIISHLIQVIHYRAAYDVELLRMFPNGVEDLIAEVQAIVDGDHPRQAALEAIREEANYHHALLDALKLYQADPRTHWRVDVMPPPTGVENMDELAEPYVTPSQFLAFCATLG